MISIYLSQRNLGLGGALSGALGGALGGGAMEAPPANTFSPIRPSGGGLRFGVGSGVMPPPLVVETVRQLSSVEMLIGDPRAVRALDYR